MAVSNIFSHLIELTSNVTDAFATVLYSANNEKETYQLKEFFSLHPDLSPPITVPFGESPISKAVASRKPLVLDYFNPETANLKIFKKVEDLKSFLIVPVIHNELEGVLVIATKEAYGFSPKLQKIVGGLSEQIAWNLLQEKQSTDPSGKADSTLTELNTYLRFLAESPDKDTVAKRLVEIPASILKCDATAIVRFDENGLGKVWEHRGFNEDPSLYNLRQGTGIVGTCAQSRAPIIHTNFENTLMALFSSNENTGALKSVIAAPILHDKRLFGVLVAGSLAMNGLSRYDLDKLTLIASGAASSLVFVELKNQQENEKNRDPITGIYNHRFLINYQRAVSKKIFNGSSPVFFLTVQLTNLPSLYETHGVRSGDFILRGLVSLISKKVPSPRNIFKYSDNSLLIMILKRNREEVDAIESRLKSLFNDNPLSVNEISVQVKTAWGLSSYPEEGENLHDLIGLSWARTAQPFKVTP
jgi:diguanylate cyclase (GGDEF)-like protein